MKDGQDFHAVHQDPVIDHVRELPQSAGSNVLPLCGEQFRHDGELFQDRRDPSRKSIAEVGLLVIVPVPSRDYVFGGLGSEEYREAHDRSAN